MKKLAFLCAACAAIELAAAPAAKMEPVAAGFPQWQGLVQKNYIQGREITPSDLRHRVTIVIDVEDCPALKHQMLLASRFLSQTGHVGLEGSDFETRELPRNVLIVVSCHGLLKNPDALKKALKPADNTEAGLSYFYSTQTPFYEGVSLVGGPETEGQRPYIYVMGPKGATPLSQGKLNEAGIKAASKAIGEAKAQIAKGPEWKPFYGTVSPEKYPAIAAAIAKGKPLAPVAVAIQKDILSKDAEKATDAQIVYDALSQTRSDLLFRIRLEARSCPHRAYYDFQKLVKFWPSEKKKLDDVMQRLKAIPDAEKLSKMFCKVMTWAEPDFVCKNKGEAKKIVEELKKMKPVLAKMKESKVIVVQNGALLMDAQLDTLIETIPDKIAVK